MEHPMRFRHLTGASAVLACAALTVAFLTGRSAETTPNKPALDQLPAGWETAAPRDEIRPTFAYDPTGGPKKDGAFIISDDDREGLHGYFHKTFPIAGGKYYHFHAVRKVQNVETPRRSVMARILWRDDKGHPVPLTEPPAKGYLVGFAGAAEAEHPLDKGTDENGWTEVSD